MRSLAAAALAGFLVVVAAGCAGIGGHQQSTVSRLSRAQFVHAANRVCARAHRAEKAIPNPTNTTTFLRSLRRAIPVLEHEIIGLRALKPPQRDAPQFVRVLEALDTEDVDAHELITSVDAAQLRRTKSLGRRLDRLGRRLRSLDRRLGIRECVKAA